ncbi:hypothetical protein AGMMS50256_28990 [Betaproteobacteria bacterium]|nr:hypothetical protein AGMMS50256_28990 [Betaproteobacteria bacterium]
MSQTTQRSEAIEMCEDVLGQDPADVIALVAESSEVLDRLSTLFSTIEEIAESRKPCGTPSLCTINHLAWLGRYVAYSFSDNYTRQHSDLSAALKAFVEGQSK